MSSSAGRKILIKLIKIIHIDVLASCGQETAFKVTSTPYDIQYFSSTPLKACPYHAYDPFRPPRFLQNIYLLYCRIVTGMGRPSKDRK